MAINLLIYVLFIPVEVGYAVCIDTPYLRVYLLSVSVSKASFQLQLYMNKVDRMSVC